MTSAKSSEPALHQQTRQLQAHPPRSLQHSPSLPNIWFPPHQGPIPDQFKNGIARENLHQPATPPGLSKRFSLPPSPNTSPKKFVSPATAETPKAEPVHLPELVRDATPRRLRLQPIAKHAKSDARLRVGRQVPHKLLTPPLTPSSSIRTTASSDSALTDFSDSAGSHTGEVDPKSTRYLLVGNISRASHTKALTCAFTTALSMSTLGKLLGSSFRVTSPLSRTSEPTAQEEESPLKGVFVRYVESQGVVVLAFYDIRYATAAKRLLAARHSDSLDEYLEDKTQWFRCNYLSDSQLYQMIGEPTFLGGADFYICFEECDLPTLSNLDINGAQLLNLLLSFGPIHSWEIVHSLNDENSSRSYHVEYCDIRRAIHAFRNLNGTILSGKRLDLRASQGLIQALGGPAMVSRLKANHPGPSIQHHPNERPASPSQNLRPDKPQIGDRFIFPEAIDSLRRYSDGADPTTCNPNDAIQNDSPMLFYTSPPSSVTNSRAAPSVGRHSSQGSVSELDQGDVDNLSQGTQSDSDSAIYSHPSAYYPRESFYPPPGGYGIVGYPATPPMQYPCPAVSPSPFELVNRINGISLNNYPFDPSVPFTNCLFPPIGYPSVPAEFWQQQQQCTPPGLTGTPAYFSVPDSSDGHGTVFLNDGADERDNGSSDNRQVRCHGPLKKRSNATPGTTADPTKNQLALDKIENDIRTTVMIKNIPNKMSDRDLITYINKVCPRRIDFLYLRVDFTNGCNVGYAFVNFIEVKDLLLFAQKRLGQKWNMFSSDKVLQMSYANYQGKEALVEKFKNSSIMDEQEAWQPKIFYSKAGPNQGLPEPFPAPTHMRRKERSLHNRGHLFTPSNGSSLLDAGPPRCRADNDDRSHGGQQGERRSRFRLTEGLGRQLLAAASGKSSQVF